MNSVTDIEQVILGSIISDVSCFDKVYGFLEPDDFNSTIHADIYNRLEAMKERGEEIDIVTVGVRYEDPAYITNICSRVGTTAHIKTHALILKEQRLRKEASDLDEKDILETVNKLYLHTVEIESKWREPVSVAAALQANIEHMESGDKDKLSGLSTGFHRLDRAINGLRPGNNIVIAGSTGMGKSAFALNITDHLLKSNIPVAYFSLEMPVREQVQRLTSIRTQVDLHKLDRGTTSESEMKKVVEYASTLYDSPVYIDDANGVTIHNIKAKAQQKILEDKVQVIIIDHIGLIQGVESRGVRKTRENIVAEISRTCKQMAMQFEVPVITVAQLNRQNLSRTDKRPQIGDLRESGSIEQDADIILFPYRPEVYGIEQLSDGASTQGYAELIVGKNRNGPTLFIPMNFEGSTVTFSEQTLYDRLP